MYLYMYLYIHTYWCDCLHVSHPILNNSVIISKFNLVMSSYHFKDQIRSASLELLPTSSIMSKARFRRKKKLPTFFWVYAWSLDLPSFSIHSTPLLPRGCFLFLLPSISLWKGLIMILPFLLGLKLADVRDIRITWKHYSKEAFYFSGKNLPPFSISFLRNSQHTPK